MVKPACVISVLQNMYNTAKTVLRGTTLLGTEIITTNDFYSYQRSRIVNMTNDSSLILFPNFSWFKYSNGQKVIYNNMAYFANLCGVPTTKVELLVYKLELQHLRNLWILINNFSSITRCCWLFIIYLSYIILIMTGKKKLSDYQNRKQTLLKNKKPLNQNLPIQFYQIKFLFCSY